MVDIKANDIAVRFGRTSVLEGVRFTLRAGEMVGLIGPNGSGKTSLLQILANLRAPEAESVRYGGRSAADIGSRELSTGRLSGSSRKCPLADAGGISCGPEGACLTAAHAGSQLCGSRSDRARHGGV